MASQTYIKKTMSNKRVIDKDVIEGEVIPCEEILTGRAYKQRGKMVSTEGVFDYYLERVPGSEDKIEIMDKNFNLKVVDGAEFEFWVFDPTEQEWYMIDGGMAPVERTHHVGGSSPFIP